MKKIALSLVCLISLVTVGYADCPPPLTENLVFSGTGNEYCGEEPEGTIWDVCPGATQSACEIANYNCGVSANGHAREFERKCDSYCGSCPHTITGKSGTPCTMTGSANGGVGGTVSCTYGGSTKSVCQCGTNTGPGTGWPPEGVF